jgi:AraC-like DNA-binding protein
MRSPLSMTEYRPAGRLGSYVRAFQVFSLTDPAGAAVLDFGGADVSVPICFGDRPRVEDQGGADVPSAAVVGPRRRATLLRFEGAVDQVNVSFYPGEASAFLHLPMCELADRMAAPQDAWPGDFLAAVAELAPLPVKLRLRALGALLLDRLEPGREATPQVREAIRLIHARSGQVTVRWLADEVNLSISQLERGFARHVGAGPKLVARQARISALAAAVMAAPTQAQPPNWASLATRYGFADQSHLVREFRELTGLTPARFGRIGQGADFLQDAIAACQGEWSHLR